MDTLIKYAVGIVGLGFLLGIVLGVLPTEFSFYTLQEFYTDLDSIGGFFSWALGFFSAWIDAVLFLLIFKIIIWSLIAGATVKVGVLVYNIFTSGGA
jgi:hypothetical protein